MKTRADIDVTQHTADLLEDLDLIVGAVVRVSDGDPRVMAALLLGYGEPLLTLNASIVGTDEQAGAIIWAIARIRNGVQGFHYQRSGA